MAPRLGFAVIVRVRNGADYCGTNWHPEE